MGKRTGRPTLVKTGGTEGCSGWGFNGNKLADGGVAVVAVGVCEGCACGAGWGGISPAGGCMSPCAGFSLLTDTVSTLPLISSW